MECSEARRLMDAYVDGELDLVRHAEIDSHLEQCAGCRARAEARAALRSAVRTEAEYFRAAASLERTVRRRIRDRFAIDAAVTDQGDSTASRLAPRGRARPVRTWRPAFGLAAAAAVIFMLASAVIWLASTRPTTDGLIAQEIVSSHIRSLMPGHLTDVPSSDQHTVKPWFDGKADFSPPVPEFAAEGFSLIGGRLDYLGGRTVAAISYRRRQHVINVFIWPSASQSGTVEFPGLHGYNLLHWSRGGYAFWAVSDLNTREMTQFAGLFQRTG